MSRILYKIILLFLSLIVLLTFLFLFIKGISYYRLSLEERVYHASHAILKPSGAMGHGLGIFGTLLIILGVSLYMARKRYRWLARAGSVKHWLEFHIFLCVLGPVLILFHTAFKFGGVVAISFWSMVAVFLSGIIGRFIYLQIPHSIEGRELSLNEIRNLKSNFSQIISESYHLDENSKNILNESVKKKAELYHRNIFVRFYRQNREDKKSVRNVKKALKQVKVSNKEQIKILRLVKNDISLNRKIERLETMQNLFKYWHVAHLPFALVMLIIMVIHVIITITFGYKWIF